MDPQLWDDPQNASKLMQRMENLRAEVLKIERLTQSLDDLDELEEMASTKEDQKMIEAQKKECGKEIDELEFRTLLSGQYDSNDALLTIRSGAGGVDAQDWAEMLLRMYTRYAERREYAVTILEKSQGAEAGIKSVLIEIRGEYAYGYLSQDSGVHRLVRLSPFNADSLRQTSFAQVEVMPSIDDAPEEAKIDPQELRVDTFRASGAGGQHVNTTDSAVRITHIPTNLVASCQSERSQQKNKERAMKLLQSKIVQKLIEEKEKERRKLRGETQAVEWGSQIRSYVLHPYKLVKDHRTGHESANTDAILDGEIQDFIEAMLKERVKREVDHAKEITK